MLYCKWLEILRRPPHRLPSYLLETSTKRNSWNQYQIQRKPFSSINRWDRYWQKGFQLTKWISNWEKRMMAIDPNDKPYSSSKTLEAELASPTMLGLQWILNVNNMEVCPVTQKEVLERVTWEAVLFHVSDVLDPLELVSNIAIRMTLSVETFWKENGQSWHKELCHNDSNQFTKWS